MSKCIVFVNKLNKRTSVPSSFSNKNNIAGVVNKGFTFTGEEATDVESNLGKWFRDRDNFFYWSGGLTVIEDKPNEADGQGAILITPVIKKKIEQVVNVFETGSADGNYATLVKYDDYNDPETHQREVQITYGRSQTTEFSHLNELAQDYVERNGMYAEQLKKYLGRIGKKPSLASDENFCKLLKDAGKNDPIMKDSQDRLFDVKYYEPSFNWFTVNKFTFPLSLLVIYDSYIHSGGILIFLRQRFATLVPLKGGIEKDWITNYVNVRHEWLANHSNPLLRQTTYRTKCFKEQIQNNNWDLSQKINTQGTTIS